ncbi:SHOCT domain-containing protein [Aestuariimicrobium sp. Y1814]|uniref:SHOCT domain-containing protein n=1 Tax=Aestuariimicrobium sp. Y1814 TaxID=3418742 RepID=UPI003DA770D5
MSILSSAWDVLWFMLTAFVFIAYLMALFSIITDLFRDRELSGLAKAVWLIFLIWMPFITAVVYLIVRGKGMGARATARADEAREATEAYVRSVAGTNPAAEIAQAKQLLDSGAITPDEFTRLKNSALAHTTT